MAFSAGAPMRFASSSPVANLRVLKVAVRVLPARRQPVRPASASSAAAGNRRRDQRLAAAVRARVPARMAVGSDGTSKGRTAAAAAARATNSSKERPGSHPA